MKRAATGGTHRGPVAHSRQRRTIRFVQILLVLIAAGLLAFAGYSWGRADGFDEGRRAGDIGGPRKPGVTQTVVLAVLGLGALGAAFALGGPGGVRIPTPARLEELSGRAEAAAIDRATHAGAERSTAPGEAATRGPRA
jgi:hypothetical protein